MGRQRNLNQKVCILCKVVWSSFQLLTNIDVNFKLLLFLLLDLHIRI